MHCILQDRAMLNKLMVSCQNLRYSILFITYELLPTISRGSIIIGNIMQSGSASLTLGININVAHKQQARRISFCRCSV